MSELPPDLPRLRVLETWLVLCLDRVRREIADKERRELELRQAEERQPLAPDWLVKPGIGSGPLPIAVHVGSCHMTGKRRRGVSQEEARRALAGNVEACPHCSPDNALGMGIE